MIATDLPFFEDLLLAVAGHTGSVFVDGETTVEILPAVASSLDAPILFSIKELLPFGFFCARLEVIASFIEHCCDMDHQNPIFDDSGDMSPSALFARKLRRLFSEPVPSLALYAVSQGLRELIARYRGFVASEASALAAAGPGLDAAGALVALRAALLREWSHSLRVLTEALTSLLVEAAEPAGRTVLLGGALLARMTDMYHGAGDPVLRRVLLTPLAHVQRAVAARVISLLSEGAASDPHGEMFVTFRRGEAADDALWVLADPTRCAIRADLLPPFVSLASAREIVFLGSAARILKEAAAREAEHGAGRAEALGLSQADSAALTRTISVPLAAVPAQRMLFEVALQRAGAVLNDRLWALLVRSERTHMFYHLRCVADLFTQNDGAVWLEFLESARGTLTSAPTPNAAATLKLAFEAAVSSEPLRYLADAPGEDAAAPDLADPAILTTPFPPVTTLARIGFECSAAPRGGDAEAQKISVPAPPTLGAWNALALTYAVPPLLRVFFTDNVMAAWARLWRYLFVLQRVRWILMGAATRLRCLPAFTRFLRPPRMLPLPPDHVASAQRTEHDLVAQIWRTLHRMTLFIRTQLARASTEILRPALRAMLARVAATTDFREMQRAQRDFLAAIHRDLHFGIPAIGRAHESALEAILQFCAAVEAGAARLIGVYEDTARAAPVRPSEELREYVRAVKERIQEFERFSSSWAAAIGAPLEEGGVHE